MQLCWSQGQEFILLYLLLTPHWLWDTRRLEGKKISQAGTKFCQCYFAGIFPLLCITKFCREEENTLWLWSLKTALSAGERWSRKLVRNNNLNLCVKCYVAMTATSLCYSRAFVPSPALEICSPDLLFSLSKITDVELRAKNSHLDPKLSSIPLTLTDPFWPV